MSAPVLTPADESFLDELFERAVRSRSLGEQLDLDGLLPGFEHLRAPAEEVLALAREVAIAEAPRPLASMPRTLLGFTLLDEVGRGAMGLVYRAHQERLDRVVALKVLAPALGASEPARQRFASEARALGRVQHPNVVAVHDVVVTDELCAYAMEWIDGVTLSRAITDRDPRLDVSFVVRLGVLVARALEAVHGAGLVHRDIKPSNILLRADGTPVLTDFGLVLDAQHSNHTATGEFLGTVAFAAPEQLRGDHSQVGRASDVYSLAATLYAAATGQTPFGSTSTAEMLRRAEVGSRTAMRRLNPKVPRDLETVVAKAMDPTPARRYPTAAAFADDLERILRLEPIQARPASLALRLQRLSERNPVLTLLLVGLVLALGLGLGFSLYFLQRARNEAEVQAQTVDFFRNVFRHGDPTQWGATDRTVLDAVAQVADQLQKEDWRSYQPAVRLTLQLLVVETFVNSGRNSAAHQHLLAAQPVAHAIHGSDSAQAAEIAHQLGRVARSLGRLSDAEAHLREAVRIRGLLGDAKERELAQSLASLGITLRHLGKYPEAEAAYREALAVYRRHNSYDNMSQVLGNLASAQESQGLLAQAEATVTEALTEAHRMHRDTPHLDVSIQQFRLGGIQHRRGDTAAGLAGMRAALAMTKSLGGEHHPRYAVQASHLAGLLQTREPVEAEALFRASLAAYVHNQSPVEASAQARALGALLVSQGRLPEAESVLEQAVAHAGTTAARPESLRHLGQLRLRQRRFAAAEAILTQAWSHCDQNAQAAERKAIAGALAEVYRGWAEAEPDAARSAKAAEWRKTHEAGGH